LFFFHSRFIRFRSFSHGIFLSMINPYYKISFGFLFLLFFMWSHVNFGCSCLGRTEQKLIPCMILFLWIRCTSYVLFFGSGWFLLHSPNNSYSILQIIPTPFLHNRLNGVNTESKKAGSEGSHEDPVSIEEVIRLDGRGGGLAASSSMTSPLNRGNDCRQRTKVYTRVRRPPPEPDPRPPQP
jgi:hypothetical protein